MIWRSWRQRLFQRYMRWRLFGFARVLFWGDKFEQRFTFLGRWLFAAILLTLIFGANLKQSNIHQLFAVLLAMICSALLTIWLRSFFNKKKFELKRKLPAFAQVGKSCVYSIQVQNMSGKVLLGLRLNERFAPVSPNVVQFLLMREPNEEKRNWYDRNTGFHRFVWLQEWLSGGVIKPVKLDMLEAKARKQVEISWLPKKRGRLYFSKLRIAVPDYLGLVCGFEVHDLPQSLLVLPKIYTVPIGLIKQGNQKDQQHGLSIAADVGDSEAFHRMREYRVGDSPRHIHWASLARGEKPLVKEFEDEFFTRQTLILDNIADAKQSLIFEEAVSVAAGFADAMQKESGILDFIFAAPEQKKSMAQISTSADHGQSLRVLETLAMLSLSEKTMFDSFSLSVLQKAEGMQSCVYITIVWDKKRQALIEALKQRMNQVSVYLVTDGLSKETFPNTPGFHVLNLGHIEQNLVECSHD